MMAFTSSELTMLSILLQNTPEAVGSTMMKIQTTAASSYTLLFRNTTNSIINILNNTRSETHTETELVSDSVAIQLARLSNVHAVM